MSTSPEQHPNPYAGSTVPDRPGAAQRTDDATSPYARPTEYRDDRHPRGAGLLGYGRGVEVEVLGHAVYRGRVRDVGPNYVALSSFGSDDVADVVIFTGPGVVVTEWLG